MNSLKEYLEKLNIEINDRQEEQFQRREPAEQCCQ